MEYPDSFAGVVKVVKACHLFCDAKFFKHVLIFATHIAHRSDNTQPCSLDFTYYV